MNIYYDEIPYDADIAEYLNETIDVYKTSKNFEIVSQNTSSFLSGLPAYEIVYTYTYEDEGIDGIEIKVYEIGTLLNNSQGYFINFQSEKSDYDAYFPIAKQSINSFEIDKVIEKSIPITPSTPLGLDPGRNFLNYSNPETGINFLMYPETYELLDDTKEPSFSAESNEGTILLEIMSPITSGLDDQQEYLQIGAAKNYDILTRNDSKTFVEDYLKMESDNPSFELVESKYSDLIDGFDTFKTFDQNQQVPLQVTMYAIPISDKVYWITIIANPQQYDKYIPIFDTMLNSIDFAEPKSSISIDEYRPSNFTFNEAKYVKLSLDEWRSNNIDVVVLVNEDTKNQSSKYVTIVTEAVQEWSDLLKQYSNNSNVWNFNVRAETGNLETVQPSNPNTIILEMVSTPLEYNYYADMLGFASPHSEGINKPVVATILTSCSDGFKILDLPDVDVYSTAIHEFAHTLGLGHAFNIDYDLMCSYD
ncbi:MAG: hypothetical protein L0H53_12150 [Candidatus Nitrosocosmicus sp.]|nr:hypothetical protein [Candidatus Nitrosocosmicus sp.]MDN5868083.1 hypothetical protein [Candidatus Nitrosocosmicus sp.]